MKKITSFLLSVMMILSCVSVVFANEYTIESGKQLALVVENVEVTDTTNIVVPVKVDFADGYTAGVAAGYVGIEYPADKLEVVSAAWKVSISSTNPDYATPGVVKANFATTNPHTADGDFLEIVFKAKDGVSGEVDITIDEVETYFADYDDNDVFYTAVNAKIVLPAVEEKFDVTFDANLESVTNPDAITGVEAGTEIDLPKLDDTEDYSFRGWQINGEGDIYTGKYIVTADTAFKGAWDVIEKYDVTFVSDYGTAPAAMTGVVKGTKFNLETLANTDDFTFGGWTDGETEYAAGAEYEVTKDVTLTAIWNEIVKYTVTFSEGADPVTVVAGKPVTVPTLTKEDLVFTGWKVGETDQIVAGGAEFIPTASVLLTAKWGGGKKVYISATGLDTNNGFTADAPVATLKKAYEIVNTEGNTIEEIIIIGAVSYEFPSTAIDVRNLGIDGKTLTFKGIADGETAPKLSFTNPNGAAAGRIYLRGELTFENITFDTNNTGEVPYATLTAKSITINNGVKFLKGGNKTALVGTDYADPNPTAVDNTITINDKDFEASLVNIGAGYGGGTKTGKLKLVMNGGSIPYVKLNKGSTGDKSINSTFKGTVEFEINDGTIGTELGFHQGANFNGLGYMTINGGTIKTLYTTGVNHSWASWNAVIPFPLDNLKGVMVYEINGGTVTEIKRQADTANVLEKYNSYLTSNNQPTIDAFPDAWTNVTRFVIFNEDVDAIEVADEGAIVLDVANGKLSADVTVADNYATTINGLTYTLAEGADFNAVKVGDKTYVLADLTNGLIPAPEAAGVYDVEFTNVYKVTIGEETTLVEEGDTIALTRLPKDGELKHIGWTTVENGTTAEINHTAEYVPTADVTLYPVWADAVYFTVEFVSAHGDQIEKISKIDDNEDGEADETIVLPGYDTTVKFDDHFTFKGWATTEGSEDVAYIEGGIIENLAENIVLYAVWAEDPKATVTYVDTQATAPEAVTDYVGTEITVAAPGAATVEGLEFLGWTDGTTVYQPENMLIIDADGVTLTAKWGVKIKVDANGAKGDASKINVGGVIGEEIPLPTEEDVTACLTYVNHTFKGFALSADGDILTTYTVNPDDTLYVIWEEAVKEAALIKTKVTYYTGTGNYLVDIYFYGKDANTVAFGYAYGENLDFVGFAPGEGLSIAHNSIETNEDGYYSNVVANTNTGKIAAADKTEEDAIHLGTLTLSYTGAKEDYSAEDAADNVAITLPKAEAENIASADYFLYVPAVAGLEVTGKPVVFDEVIDINVINVEYPIKGSVRVVRSDDDAPKNFAAIKVLNEAGLTVSTIAIENAETKTEDGVFNYEIKLPEGKYTLVYTKTGYLNKTVEVTVEAQEGAEDKAYEDLEVTAIDHIDLVAGDVYTAEESVDVIDLLDFVSITSHFGIGEISDEDLLALDIDEDGAVTVDDLGFIKENFGKEAE